MMEEGMSESKQAAQEWPKKIRTTMEPDREYEVDEAEYTDLKRRGLLKGGK